MLYCHGDRPKGNSVIRDFQRDYTLNNYSNT